MHACSPPRPRHWVLPLQARAQKVLTVRAQVLAGQECSEKADIWSLGVVLWEIVTGERPHLRQLRPLRCVTLKP